MRLPRSFYSSCDSRNLNLSPFCNLTSTSLAMWQASVLETYGNQTTSYIEGISGPMRANFPNSMEERELITALVKVDFLHLLWTSKLLGGDVLQRLWEGYRHCKHLFWRANSIRWVRIHYNQNLFISSEFERLPKMTWLDFISGFGGLCGLCLGISFASLAEILYWFSIRLCRKLWFEKMR